MSFHMALAWHEGEKKMHDLLHISGLDNPTMPQLTQQAARMLQVAPLIAIGTLDDQNRPWTTVWGGQSGMSQPLGNSMIGIKTLVDRKHDPVVNILYGSGEESEVVREEGNGRMIAGLAIDLETRKRVKIYGRLVAGAVAIVEEDRKEEVSGPLEDRSPAHQIQLVCRIDQSLGNCPKYLNSKHLQPRRVHSSLISDSLDLSSEAIDLIHGSDLFFVSSSHSQLDMDTNHRGGPTGFVRTRKSNFGEWEIFWPEYSGNRLYQTLGNLQATPQAGLTFPDFVSGDVLYLTGATEVLVGKEAADVLPRSNLAVKFTVKAAKYVKAGLPFRGTPGEQSPYNPKVRPLAGEATIVIPGKHLEKTTTATLLDIKKITPTIFRYQFSMSNPAVWKAGGWVALDFSSELNIGYSHMRDDDPLSLNDDFIRTFTVSSPPVSDGNSTFEVTARTVGVATTLLSKQQRGGLEIPIQGFGGEVAIDQEDDKITPVVAGGVGITPLMAQISNLDLGRLQLFWTVRVDDLGLVLDVLERTPDLAKHLALFITGAHDLENAVANSLRKRGVSCQLRRLEKTDLDMPGLSNRWHICVSSRLRQSLSEWLRGKEMVNEDFNF